MENIDFKINKGTLLESLDIEFLILSKEKVSARMPISNKTKQIFGVLHGGASAALLETVASVGSCLNIKMDSQNALGIELNISHLRSMREGFVVATATPIRLGKSIHVWTVTIANEADSAFIVAEGRCSVFIKDKVKESNL